MGGAHALSSSVRIGPFQSLRPHWGFPPSRWRKWPGHRPKGCGAARRGSLRQPRDSARAGLYRLCPEGTQADLLLCPKHTCRLLGSPEQVAYHRPREDGAAWRLPHLEPGCFSGAGQGQGERLGENSLFNTAANTLQRGPECYAGGANWFSAGEASTEPQQSHAATGERKGLMVSQAAAPMAVKDVRVCKGLPTAGLEREIPTRVGRVGGCPGSCLACELAAGCPSCLF